MSSSGAARLSRGVLSLPAFGHSYLTTGAVANDYLWHADLGRMLDSVVNNQGVSGARLCIGSGAAQGGYATVLQNFSPAVARNMALRAYSAEHGIPACLWGLNDLGDVSTNNGVDTAAVLAAFKHAVRATIAHLQASLLFQHADATVTLGGAGAWTTQASVQQNSGADYTQNPTAGGTITLTMPATFLGGDVALGFLTNRVGGALPAGPVTFTLDGQAVRPIGFPGGYTTDQINPAGVASVGASAARFAVSAGAHSLVATVGAGGLAFDRWSVASQPARPILWANVARTPAASVTQLAAIAQWNALLPALLAEFTNVVLVDIDSALGNDPAVFELAGVHPNDTGHARIAAAFYDALARSGFLGTSWAYV